MRFHAALRNQTIKENGSLQIARHHLEKIRLASVSEQEVWKKPRAKAAQLNSKGGQQLANRTTKSRIKAESKP